MSYKTELGAKKAAEQAQAIMGPEWKIRVHQNLGWHASLQLDRFASISIYNYPRNKNKFTYSCLISDGTHIGSGNGCWSTRGNGPFYCPMAAFKNEYDSFNKYWDSFHERCLKGDAIMAAAIKDVPPPKPIKKTITIEVVNVTDENFELAVEEAARQIKQGLTEGSDKFEQEGTGYDFTVRFSDV
jgi:hypothetical protein